MNMKIIIKISIIQLISISSSLFASFFSKENFNNVAVIVNSELYPRVKDSIDLYISDLKNEGYEAVFSEWNYKEHPDAEELRNTLKAYHENNQIQGAVLIGELPYIQRKDINNNKGPIDIYLMDFNNDHFIKENDGDIKIPNSIHADIWVSRIWAPKDKGLFEGISEAKLIKNYFKKNHAYRTCQSPVPDLKIRFEAGEMPNWFFRTAEYLKTWIDFYQQLSKAGYSEEYLKFVRENPAQFLYLQSHSTSQFHNFKHFDRNIEFLSSKEIVSKAKNQQPFLLLNACSACNFLDSYSLGNAYLFDINSKTLVIAGLSVLDGSLLDIAYLYSNGDNFGNNVLPSIGKFGIFRYIEPLFVAISFTPLATHILDKHATIYIVIVFEFLKYYYEYTFGWRSFGNVLLGDPTLKSYVDMAWCPEYIDKSVLKDL